MWGAPAGGGGLYSLNAFGSVFEIEIDQLDHKIAPSRRTDFLEGEQGREIYAFLEKILNS